ncbi:MAG TPA: DUF2283 domain-containing protein [Alphaproteobacteria bacterium]|nr:DUF2283 domain-containing protein [Alphaproteobacteria bacterium]
MASPNDILELDYDAENDVLYASLGTPQAALSYEMMEDVLLRYVPPSPAVVGITIINFLRHYPLQDTALVLSVAKAVVENLLEKYPTVPLDQREGNMSTPEDSRRSYTLTTHIEPVPWLQISTSAPAGTYTIPLTQSIGLVSLFESPRIQPVQSKAKDDAA